MSPMSASAASSFAISAPIMRMAVYTPAMSFASLMTTFTPFCSSSLACSSVWDMSLISTTCGSSARISSMLVSAPDCTTGRAEMDSG